MAYHRALCHKVSSIMPRGSSHPRRFAIKRQTSVGSSRNEHLIPSSLWQPLDAPKRLVRFTVCSHTRIAIDRPHLDFAVKGTTKKILTSVTPVEAGNPSRVASQIADVLPMFHVVECNETCIASSSKASAGWGECD